jgi:VanZ family protein
LRAAPPGLTVGAFPDARPARPVVTSPLRYLILAGLLLVPLFFPRIRPPDGRVWGAAWDALHFPGFILITWTFALLLRRFAKSDTSAIVAGAALALLIATLSELSHDYLGRSSSWKDFGVDCLGIGFGVAGWFLLRRGGSAPRVVFAGLVVATLGLLVLPALRGSRAVREIRGLFPDLGAFHHFGSRHLWVAQGNATATVHPDEAALHVRIGPGHFGGVSYWPAQGDWSGRQTLHIGVDNPGDTFPLGIRIDDVRSASSRHDSRYNGERQIPPGHTEIRLPLAEIQHAPAGRTLDLTRIRRLVLFTGEETTGRQFVIDSAFLD